MVIESPKEKHIYLYKIMWVSFEKQSDLSRCLEFVYGGGIDTIVYAFVHNEKRAHINWQFD